MNNLSSYCGLVDAKIRDSDKDLPVECPVLLLFKAHNKTELLKVIGNATNSCKHDL